MIKNIKKHLSSNVFYLIACAGIIATATIYPKWQKSGTEATLSWDVMGYYLYLPAALIYQDISQLQFKDTILKKYRPTGSFYQAYAHPKTGKYVMKYPIGLALLYLPFFALGHLYALTSDFPPDGFSLPYQAAISFGSMFFAFVGLWFCQQALRQYFANTIAGVVILLIALSTNYLNYTAVDGAMAHNWGFSLLAILLYYTIKWYEQPSYGKSILIGVCLGLAILVRPTNILGALIPIFWGLKDYAAFQERIELFQNSWKLLLVALFSVVAIGSIQLIYWKFITDDWIFYTYNEQGFSWFKPHVKNVLISYKKGWLMYTPIMILALTGFWYLYQNFRKLFPFCLVFFLVNFYIVSAWDVWGYGGAFGQRALIEGYTILAFPMAALLVHVQKLGWQRWLLIAFAIFCTWLNCFQTWQAHGHGFETEAMTKAYFWRIFANANPTELDRKLLDTKEDYQGERKKVEQIYWNDFEGIFEGNISTTAKAKSGKKSWLINGGIEFSPALTIKVEARSNEWLRVGADFFLVSKEWDVWKMTQLIVEFRKGEEIIKKRVIRVQRQLSENAWQKNWTDMKIPKIDFDTVRVYFWNPNSQKDLYIDDLTVETYEPS